MFFPVDARYALMIYQAAFPAQHNVYPVLPKALSLFGKFKNPLAQGRFVLATILVIITRLPQR